MSEKLKPCPFCGGRVKVFRYIGASGDYQYQVACLRKTCPVQPLTNWADIRKTAIEMWNTRHEDVKKEER